MDTVMFSSSVDRSMSNHQNFSRIGGGGDGILMKPVPPPSFSSGGRPPLLPLPTNSKPYYSYSSLPLPVKRTPNNKRGRRALSSSPPTTNKKPLPPSRTSTSPKKSVGTNRLGPEPSDLPKQVCLKAISSDEDGGLNSIFCLAPPPSSLPLPKFFLKPKLVSCNIQAVNLGGGGKEDDGATATDNLRRLLRLC